jgi:hypothetical protein
MPFVNSVAGKFGFGRPTVDIRGSIQFISAQTQYLEVALTAIGNSTATVELWFNASANNTEQRILTTSTLGFATGDFSIRYTGSNFVVGDGIAGITSSTLPSAGVWNHVAWVGTGGTSQELFLNGSRVGTGTTYNFVDSIFYLGGRRLASALFNGYISNVRYVRGSALYTGSTYTVPTEPLYPVTGTELLLKTMYGPYYAKDSSINNYNVISRGTPNDPSSSILTPF